MSTARITPDQLSGAVGEGQTRERIQVYGPSMIGGARVRVDVYCNV